MRWWAYARQFPKYAIVFGTIIGSTLLFALWWITRPHPVTPSEARDSAAERADIAKRAVKAEARIDYLFLADDDLYDAGTGECLFKNWLRGDHPVKLFYDQSNKRLFAQYEQGFASYAFDGTRTATMMLPKTPPAITPSNKKVVFAKGKNVWAADIDWHNFKFVNERQVTTIDSFYEQHFAENILLLTDKTLVVRSMNNILRVDLETGNVKPMHFPFPNIGKHRSPDSKWIVVVLNGQFVCYDVDTAEDKSIPVGRIKFSDYLWLGNDKCICLSDKNVAAYDRIANTLTEVVTLPFPCFKIGEPSPDGRFIFCAGGMNLRNGVLVNLEEKTAGQVNGGAGICWVSNDTFAYSRDVPDSEWRGTWTMKVGEEENRISLEPYLVGKNTTQILQVQSSDVIVIVTTRGLIKLEQHASEYRDTPISKVLPMRILLIKHVN